jgi:hypothetical protein
MIIDLETLFPEGLSDETVGAVAELLNDIAQQWESHYFHRIRSNPARQQADLFDPEQPWRRNPHD